MNQTSIYFSKGDINIAEDEKKTQIQNIDKETTHEDIDSLTQEECIKEILKVIDK